MSQNANQQLPKNFRKNSIDLSKDNLTRLYFQTNVEKPKQLGLFKSGLVWKLLVAAAEKVFLMF